MPTIVTDDGVDIAWYDFGGDGPDLLLAHATGFHAHVWLPVIERLRSRFRCVAFDERGHGDSTAPVGASFDWHRLGLDVLAVVEAAGLDRPFGVGHSCGGALLLLAEEAAPGTFRALWCYEPVVLAVDDPPEARRGPLAEGALRRREVFASRDEATERFRSKPPTAGFRADALEAYVQFGFDDLADGTVRLKCRGEDEARTYEGSLAHRAFADLARVRCPVALAHGEINPHFGADALALLAERLPGPGVEVAKGLTHFGPLEDPDAAADSILRAFTSA